MTKKGKKKKMEIKLYNFFTQINILDFTFSYLFFFALFKVKNRKRIGFSLNYKVLINNLDRNNTDRNKTDRKIWTKTRQTETIRTKPTLAKQYGQKHYGQKQKRQKQYS